MDSVALSIAADQAGINLEQEMLKKFALFVVIATSVGYFENATAGLTATQQAKIVTVHNQWRKLVGVPAIKWSSSVASVAQYWANTLKTTYSCGLKHNNSGYGENLFWASAIVYSDGTHKQQAISPADVINNWANEKQYYSYSSNTCSSSRGCGHYTQIVWKNSIEVGCGKAVCADKSQVWVCNYKPAGNIVGQKPY
jgi:pathogenesis-related protein 1